MIDLEGRKQLLITKSSLQRLKLRRDADQFAVKTGAELTKSESFDFLFADFNRFDVFDGHGSSIGNA